MQKSFLVSEDVESARCQRDLSFQEKETAQNTGKTGMKQVPTAKHAERPEWGSNASLKTFIFVTADESDEQYLF
jgi:hypothetical protein